nr:hypothetical protein [uncultured Draconibacterium sp.]
MKPNYFLVFIMISLLSISLGCNEDKEMDNTIPENYTNGSYIELGLSETLLNTNYKYFEKIITTRISEYWIDGVQLIIGNDTTTYENELQTIHNANIPSNVMRKEDFYIEKLQKNPKRIKVSVSENTSSQEREFIFWFGTNRNNSHKLTIIQERR